MQCCRAIKGCSITVKQKTALCQGKGRGLSFNLRVYIQLQFLDKFRGFRSKQGLHIQSGHCTTPWSRLRRWQGLRALSVFTNPRMAILSAFPIQKTRRRLLTTTKRVCVIWKTISGSTKLPLILRRASARLFFMQNHSCFFLSPGFVVMS